MTTAGQGRRPRKLVTGARKLSRREAEASYLPFEVESILFLFCGSIARPNTVVLLPRQPRSSSSAQKPTMASPAATSPPIRPAQAPQPARPTPGQNGSATPNAQPQPPTSIPPPPTATPQNMPSNDQPPALSQNNAQAGPGPRTTQKAPPPPPSAEELAKAKRTKETIERKRKEREELLTKKDKSVGEMLVMLEDYQPLVSTRGLTKSSRNGLADSDYIHFTLDPGRSDRLLPTAIGL